MPKKHIIKCLDVYYREVIRGNKTFEVRKNDRNYNSGDIVVMCEVRKHKDGMTHLTGRFSNYEIPHVLKDYPAVQPGFVVFSIKPI